MSRGLVFAALAALLVIGLRVGWFETLTQPGPERWAVLYHHAGDVYVRMYYLAGPAKSGPAGSRLLHSALRYYTLSSKTDPASVEALASRGLVQLALSDKSGARAALANAALRARSDKERKEALSAARLVSDQTGSLALLRQAEPFLSGLAPAAFLTASVYAAAGRSDLADAEWARAEQDSAPIIPKLTGLVIICGLLGVGALAGLVASLARWRAWAASAGSEPAWGVPEAIEALVLWVFLAVVTASLLFRTGFRGRELTGAAAIVPSLVAGCGAVAWVRLVQRESRFGWDLRRSWRGILQGLAVAGILTPLALVLEHLLQSAWRPVEHPLVPVFASLGGGASRAALVVVACAVVPALEETLFRGIVYRSLRAAWSPLPAALVSALIFSVGHLSWVGFVPYLLVGLGLAWAYERSGTLLAPAVAHGAFNGFNLAILLVLFG